MPHKQKDKCSSVSAQSPPIPNTDPHPQNDPVVVHRRPALLFFPARIHSTKSSNWTGQEDSSS
jgi:hypothetical protein